MKREEFSKRTRLEAFTRCRGKCEGCGTRLRPGHFEYDHDKPAAFEGRNDERNCVVLCIGCHRDKTRSRDLPAIAKSNRLRKREAGLKKPSAFACSKNSGWKKKITGEVVRRV